MKNKEVELKPCAHCGSNGELHKVKMYLDNFSDRHEIQYGVGCTNGECLLSSFSDNSFTEDKELLISKWNTRTPNPDNLVCVKEEDVDGLTEHLIRAIKDESLTVLGHGYNLAEWQVKHVARKAILDHINKVKQQC